mgnify:CR=1 FL=1
MKTVIKANKDEKIENKDMHKKQSSNKEKVNEKTKSEEITNKETSNKEKKKFTILGFSIWRLLAYFIIYSVVGFIIETVFGMVTKGVIESRQSFLYGPFCAIYGFGAVVMILALQYFNKNQNTLFLGGFIVGSIVEYIVSWYGDIFLHVKWWDYSNMPLNINGRICVFFSLFWGFLAIYLMRHANPRVDKLIDKIKSRISIKVLKTATILMILFMLIDCQITGIAIKLFMIRKVHENDIQISAKQEVDIAYEKIYGNEEASKLINKYFGDKKMIKTFPNLKTQDINGDIIYFDCYVGDIKPYYYKFNREWRGDLVKILKHEE